MVVIYLARWTGTRSSGSPRVLSQFFDASEQFKTFITHRSGEEATSTV